MRKAASMGMYVFPIPICAPYGAATYDTTMHFGKRAMAPVYEGGNQFTRESQWAAVCLTESEYESFLGKDAEEVWRESNRLGNDVTQLSCSSVPSAGLAQAIEFAPNTLATMRDMYAAYHRHLKECEREGTTFGYDVWGSPTRHPPDDGLSLSPEREWTGFDIGTDLMEFFRIYRLPSGPNQCGCPSCLPNSPTKRSRDDNDHLWNVKSEYRYWRNTDRHPYTPQKQEELRQSIMVHSIGVIGPETAQCRHEDERAFPWGQRYTRLDPLLVSDGQNFRLDPLLYPASTVSKVEGLGYFMPFGPVIRFNRGKSRLEVSYAMFVDDAHAMAAVAHWRDLLVVEGGTPYWISDEMMKRDYVAPWRHSALGRPSMGCIRRLNKSILRKSREQVTCIESTRHVVPGCSPEHVSVHLARTPGWGLENGTSQHYVCAALHEEDERRAIVNKFMDTRTFIAEGDDYERYISVRRTAVEVEEDAEWTLMLSCHRQAMKKMRHDRMLGMFRSWIVPEFPLDQRAVAWARKKKGMRWKRVRGNYE